MIFFDSHLHLNHDSIRGREDTLWNDANQNGVTGGVIIGYDLMSSQRALQIAERLPGLHASVGISPHDILAAPDDFIQRFEPWLKHPKTVAIGECGMEYFYDAGPKEKQIEGFVRQIHLANQVGKTVVIHLRDADDDFLSILSSSPPNAAILHCFTASERVMEQAISLGYYISFSGIVTFKNAKEIQAAAARVPDKNLLIETDTPYLAPVPYRGKPCEPKMVVETARKIAELRGTSLQVIADLTRENALRAFQIDFT